MDKKSFDEFLDYWEKVHKRTERVIATIPRERFEWAPAQGKFTFADLIRHLAAVERYMFAENARCRPSRYTSHGPEFGRGYDAVLEFFRRAHREAMEIFRGLGPEDLEKKCVTPGGTAITVWKWLRSMAEHEIHHRGQIYLMLGILGVPTPPMYGLTSEQVRAVGVKE